MNNTIARANVAMNVGKRRGENNHALRWLLIAVGIVFVTVTVLLIIEPFLGKKIQIKNKSGHNIRKIELWYEDDFQMITEVMSFENIQTKTSLKESIEALELSKLDGHAWLTVALEFEEGGKAVIQTGQFLKDFKGTILLEFKDTKSKEVMLHMKAGEGLFGTSASTGCEDAFYVNPVSGTVE